MAREDNYRTETPESPNHGSFYQNLDRNPSPLRYPALENHAYIWMYEILIICF